MRNLSVIAVIVSVFIFAVASCDPIEDNGNGNGSGNGNDTIPNPSAYYHIVGTVANWQGADIDSVCVWLEVDREGKPDEYIKLASSGLVNGSFKLSLPAVIEESYLSTIYDKSNGIVISDPTAKGAIIYFVAYKKGKNMGSIGCIKEEKGIDYEMLYVYMNKSVKVTGTSVDEKEKDKTIYDADFKQGWNKLFSKEYEKETYDVEEYTTTEITGLKWHLDYDDDDDID